METLSVGSRLQTGAIMLVLWLAFPFPTLGPCLPVEGL